MKSFAIFILLLSISNSGICQSESFRVVGYYAGRTIAPDSFQVEKTIGDLFATMACHSVVRAGQSLSIEEMTELLQSMDEFPLSSFCPHGRPVSVEMSFFEIEKLFGRILS